MKIEDNKMENEKLILLSALRKIEEKKYIRAYLSLEEMPGLDYAQIRNFLEDNNYIRAYTKIQQLLNCLEEENGSN